MSSPEHVTPQAPQLRASAGTHVSAQQSWPAPQTVPPHVVTHIPPEHAVPDGHAFPQRPQLNASRSVLMHMASSPAPQQVAPPGQGPPSNPQFA
jgi:hypothetical protein